MSRVPDNPNNRSVATILLREGGVVAYPTDTLYGLGAVVFNYDAVSTMFVIKGRDRSQGVPVLIAAESQLAEVADGVPDAGLALAARFWPGALTLIVRRSPGLPLIVTGGAETVAVRLPDHPCPRALVSAVGAPITGTSANRHGGAEPTSPDEVQRQLEAAGLPPRLMVDCSHANSDKDYTRQAIAFHDVIAQRVGGNDNIVGLMVESNLFPGNQPLGDDPSKLAYGVSITDACIGWEETDALLTGAHQQLAVAQPVS